MSRYSYYYDNNNIETSRCTTVACSRDISAKELYSNNIERQLLVLVEAVTSDTTKCRRSTPEKEKALPQRGGRQ
jgi:hypothetical protein